MARVVIVSNRVPLPSERGARAGGLAVGLKDALKDGGLWFGWSGEIADDPDAAVRKSQSGGITYATIDLTQENYDRFYVGFANSTLWPLLHFRLGLIDFKREDLEGYFSVNRTFAAALARELRPDDLVWIHDYHLIPLGAELRRLGVQNRLGFFCIFLSCRQACSRPCRRAKGCCVPSSPMMWWACRPKVIVMTSWTR